MKRRAIVVVPTYNERANLESLVDSVLGHNEAVDVLIVDDNSPDGTGEIADQLAERHSGVHVLHRTEKNGLGRRHGQ